MEGVRKSHRRGRYSVRAVSSETVALGIDRVRDLDARVPRRSSKEVRVSAKDKLG